MNLDIGKCHSGTDNLMARFLNYDFLKICGVFLPKSITVPLSY